MKQGLLLKLRKRQFGMATCVVGGGSLRPEQSKVNAPNQDQVWALLGMSGYYRKFMQQYCTVALPLTNLTKKDRPILLEWTDECDRAFSQLRGQLYSGPVLRSPDFDREFVLQTDASNRGIADVLSQLGDAGQDHPVAYFSRKLLPRGEK